MVDTSRLQQQFHTCMPLFIALGDEVRLTIIETLTKAAYSSHAEVRKRGMNVMEITKQTNLSRPAISHHLKILKEAGLVGVHKEGTANYYHVTIGEGSGKLLELGIQLDGLLKDTNNTI